MHYINSNFLSHYHRIIIPNINKSNRIHLWLNNYNYISVSHKKNIFSFKVTEEKLSTGAEHPPPCPLPPAVYIIIIENLFSGLLVQLLEAIYMKRVYSYSYTVHIAIDLSI